MANISTNDKIKNALSIYHNGLTNKLDNTFVAKVSGKNLSTNDFTDELKNKLESLENISTDTFVAKVSGKNLSTNDFTDELKTKLESLETDTGLTFASGNVQPAGNNILWLDTSES